MRGWLTVVGLLLALPSAWADTGTSTSTLTIDPSATAGTTIVASDENNRNGDVSTWADAHVHRLSNTTNVGDAAAGTKNVCADAADTTDSCLRWDDTANLWLLDHPIPGSYNGILVSSGTSGLTSRALIMGTGIGQVLDESGITLHTTVPTNFGDYAARVSNTAAISVTSGTATILTFDTERWDTDTIHSTAVNTGRLTATTAGRYQMTGHVEWAASLGQGQRMLEVLLNGATVIAATECGRMPTEPRAMPCTITTHYNLAATDYVELRVTQRASGTLNVNASGNYSPEFEMVKVP